MSKSTVDTIVENTGAQRAHVEHVVAHMNAKAHNANNGMIGAEEISKMLVVLQPAVRDEVVRVLMDAFKVNLSDPASVLKAFGSVEGVCQRVPYVIEGVKAIVGAKSAESGRIARIKDAEYIYAMRISGNKVIGSVRDYTDREPDINALFMDFVDLVMSSGECVNMQSLEIRCGREAYRYLAPVLGGGVMHKLIGDPAVSEYGFEIVVV